MAVLKVEVSDTVAARVQQMAGERATSTEAILADTLAWYLRDEAAFEAAIAEGEADVAAGRTVPAEAVFEELRAIVAAAQARKAR